MASLHSLLTSSSGIVAFLFFFCFLIFHFFVKEWSLGVMYIVMSVVISHLLDFFWHLLGYTGL